MATEALPWPSRVWVWAPMPSRRWRAMLLSACTSAAALASSPEACAALPSTSATSPWRWRSMPVTCFRSSRIGTMRPRRSSAISVRVDLPRKAMRGWRGSSGPGAPPGLSSITGGRSCSRISTAPASVRSLGSRSASTRRLSRTDRSGSSSSSLTSPTRSPLRRTAVPGARPAALSISAYRRALGVKAPRRQAMPALSAAANNSPPSSTATSSLRSGASGRRSSGGRLSAGAVVGCSSGVIGIAPSQVAQAHGQAVGQRHED